MPTLSHSPADVSPNAIAALLLLARTHLRDLGLIHPTAAGILDAVGATKTRAYELLDDLDALLPTLVRPVGRPANAPREPIQHDHDMALGMELSRTFLHFIMDNPGCVGGSASRRRYDDVLRRRIIELRATYAAIDLETFAAAVCVPRGTIEDWLRAGPPNVKEAEPPRELDSSSARIQSIITANKNWRGSFGAFCTHVRHHLRVPYGRSLIARILNVYGERRPKRRPGRTPDERATRDSFEVFFAGAQWVGDGMQVPVEVNGTRFTFNLELDVDAQSGAIVGASIRDEEDSKAVIDAFKDGVNTTGRAPLGLLLDSRPSNHTEDVAAALGDTLHMRATKGRAQNKAHVEGAFGLFSQQAPQLVVNATNDRDLAKALLEIRVKTWARTLNHRPRTDRDGASRVDLYRQAQPTDEEILAARRRLEQRCRNQEKAMQTLKARSDPVVRQALNDVFERHGLADPKEHIRCAAAGYPRDAVIAAIAVFDGKKEAGTLPEGVDARYLLGIIRNICHLHESDAITEALIRERIVARDRVFAELQSQHEETIRVSSAPLDTMKRLLNKALAADRTVDRLFWLQALGECVTAQPENHRQDHFRRLARIIHATFALSRADRYTTERILARHVWPVS